VVVAPADAVFHWHERPEALKLLMPRRPFKTWRHTHRMEAIGTSHTLYEDRVEFVLRGGAVVHRLFERVVRRLLGRMFEQRHRIVQERLAHRTLVHA